jgi:hypothetical protein
MNRRRILHVLGHVPLVVLAVTAILTMTQACSGGTGVIGGGGYGLYD